MKTSAKALAFLAGAVLSAVLVTTLAFWVFKQTEAAAAARAHTYTVISHANGLLSELKDAETGQRGYVLTGDETFLAPYTAVRGQIGGHLQELRQLALGDNAMATQQHLATIVPLVEAKIAELAHVIELRRHADMAAAVTAVASGEGKHWMDAIRSEMGGFINSEETALMQREAEFQAAMRRLFSIIILSSLITAVSATAFAYLIYRQTQQRLKHVTHLQTQHFLKVQEGANKELAQLNAVLQSNEQKLAVTLNSIGDAVIATDTMARVTLLNPVAEKLTAWTQAAAIGRPIDEVFQIINKTTRLAATIPVMAALEHGTVQGLANHTVLIAQDGNEYDIADSCAPIRDHDRQVIGAVLVFRDVTADYAVQQALHDSNALVQTILNTVLDGIITFHAEDGGIETVNPAAERIFGYTAAELIGQNFRVLLPEWAKEQSRICLNACGDGASSRMGPQHEGIGQHKAGGLFPLEISLSEMQLDGQRYFTGILRDLTTRKQAEEELVKAGALQTAIFNSANFSSIATDAKGVIQIFNVGAERMLGYAAADVMNKITPADISDPQEVIVRAKALSVELATTIKPGFEALVFKASRGIEDIYELTYIRKDGSRFPAVVSVTALRDAQEAIIGYLLIGTDNTARKQAEAALIKAGALQSAIFNSANFSSIATDAKGVIQIFNVGAERMLGYAAADVMNKITPADISDPQEVIARAKALSTELETTITPGFEALVFKASRGIEDIYELTYIRKDGSRFPAVVSVTALRDAQEAIIGYLLIGTDNTARKQVEEEQKKLDQRLRDQQFYTRSLIEANIDAIMTTDPAGIITDVNKQMEALTDCTRDELIGAPFKNFFTNPERAEAAIHLVLNEKNVTNYELTARTRNGKETVVSYNATTFYDRDRNLQGVFAAARDVTERKLLDHALQETNIALELAKSVAEKANLAKSDFLSSMSHELRSPLNAILGFGQLIEAGKPPLTDSQKASIDQILQAGWYLLELINEILDLTLIDSGKVSLSPEPVSLAEVLGDCQLMIEPQAQKSGIRMIFPHFDSPCFVKADRTRVKQIFINLLSNAIKYNRPAGEVTVTCDINATQCVRISFRDTGQGLSEEKILQLFQPFNRLGQENGIEEGTGIGLVVSKRLVELMGGDIGVVSAVGVGSVFWVELNVTPEPHSTDGDSEPMAMAQPLSPDDTRLHTVLCVEDNSANLLLIATLLASRPDIRLLSARDGNRGVEIARHAQPDVILMDINLPGISGIMALEILSQDPLTSYIPVIALSANAMPRDIAKGLEAGFFRYLTKPIRVNEFMNTLDLALKLSKPPLRMIKVE
ncbi:PAS domain S-box protein [Methylovulum psychrotolerans]|uniref:PAS domain S-box protein n=1 Tax=Methylovulum psychrotolerans TaxID=1704499 RepID=UPI0018DFA283|nr:PAS domain S-box protein [Methylovulum psychrotolerans]